jgi:hypothetical protein
MVNTEVPLAEDDAMRRLKKFAQVDLDGSEGLYETTIDRWSRNAKHQFSKGEVASVTDIPQFEEGETVVFEGQEVKVKIPQGPKGTAGIMFEGHLKMVHHSKLAKLDEGVMGGVQTMAPINRIMQLAGLEHVGAVVAEEEISEEPISEETISEDAAGNMFNQLLAKNKNDPAYKNNPDAARLATVGQVLAGMQSVIADLPESLPSTVSNQLKMVPGIGVNLINAAKTLTQKGTSEA